MNNVNYKRIIRLFTFTLIAIACSIRSVYAASCPKAITCPEATEKFDDNSAILERYGLTIDYENGKYVIEASMANDVLDFLKCYDSSFKKSDIKFKVDGLYFYEPSEDIKETKKVLKEEVAGTHSDTVKNMSGSVSGYEGNIISSLNVKNGGTIEISEDVFKNVGDEDKTGIAIKLVPDGFKDPELTVACSKKNMSFYAMVYTSVDKGEEEDENEDDPIPSTIDTTVVSNDPIDCTGDYTSRYKGKSEFKYNYCKDYNAANASSTTKRIEISDYKKDVGTATSMIKYENKKAVTEPFSYQCNYLDTKGIVADGSDDYYVNKNYIIGHGKITVPGGEYQYTGEYSNTVKTTASCELDCKEVVKVEYGPPVASKAGLCFEYKVKVTSRVSCTATEPNKPPKQYTCTPVPWCTHPGGYTAHQGGPSDDFDECVNTCDGGTYSDRCTNKCYKQVYGESLVRQTTGEEIEYNSDGTAATWVTDDKGNKLYKIDGNGTVWVINENGKEVTRESLSYQYKYNKGTLIWAVSSKKRKGATKTTAMKKAKYVITDSYWHKTKKWGYKGSTYTEYSSAGIPKIEDCTSKRCWWELSKKKVCKNTSNYRYLNNKAVYTNRSGKSYPGISAQEIDKKKNEEIYNELKKKCSAFASCNTTTAEFTISVEYTEKGKETTTTKINFPYTENNDENSKDAITHNDNDSISCPTNANSIILKSRGCYNCGGAGANITENEGEEGLKKMYMTEWSFPGTWIHNKTGKISYKPITDGTWRKIKEKFCLPLNAGNVNAKWYNYYQYQTKGNDTSYTYYNPDYIKNVECPDGTTVQTKCGSDNIVPTDEDIKYNIKATARKFGLFEWDIDIKCFYAVNDIFPKEKESDTCSLTCGSTEKYRVRSVDLNNLFPDKNGTQLTDTSTTGRTPGFNWSTYANQTNKDVDYTSAPSNYAKWIQFQAANGGIYNDEYLDYEVTLTKEIINDIKQDFKSDRSYISWKGNIVNTDDEASANSYRSPLFEQGGLLAGDSVYPNGEALKCNNIGAHTKSSNYSAVCAEFNNSGKEGK